jgi:hypothetical protein
MGKLATKKIWLVYAHYYRRVVNVNSYLCR